MSEALIEIAGHPATAEEGGDSTEGASPQRPLPRLGGVAAGAFLFAIIVTGAVEVFMPPNVVVLVGEEKRAFESTAGPKSFWDGSLAATAESRFKLRGRVRRLLAPYWAAVTLALGDTPGGDIIVGDDGWLFFRSRAELREVRKREGREILANLFGVVRRSLHVDGIDIVAVPIPRKAVICGEFLPRGINVDAEFDSTVIEALRSRGIETIDIAPYWKELEGRERYLRYDTHWAPGARIATARAMRDLIPELPRNTASYSLRFGEIKKSTGALRYAGIDGGHPAEGLYDLGEDRRLALVPEGTEERINGGEIESDVLLVGSSFCDAYQMQAILSNELQAPIMDASEEGEPPLYSLWKAVMTTPREELPRLIVSEFPIHQAAEVGRGAEPMIRAALGLARSTGYRDRSQVIDPAVFAKPRVAEASQDTPLIFHSQGTLLSSGDGVLGLQLQVTSQEWTRWQINSSGAVTEIQTKPGTKVRAIPIIENDTQVTHFGFIKPANGGALRADVELNIVTDADLAGGRRFGGADCVDGRWFHEEKLRVDSFDSLALTWAEFTNGPIEVVCRGTDDDGQPVEQRWAFPGAREARFLIVTLGALEGGVMNSIELTGAAGRVDAVLAPQTPR